MRNYRELQVWERAHRFTLRVHALTQNFPWEEKSGLSRQLRRASASIPSNIAEGCGRDGNPDFIRFLDIALGSANEADYQLLLARDLGYIQDPDYTQLAQEVAVVQKMLTTFILKIRVKRKQGKA